MRHRRAEGDLRRGLNRRLVALVGYAVVGVALSLGAAVSAHAQTSEAGVSFLIIPIGARLVGIGGAGVADPAGQLAFLSNPAAFARLRRRDASFDFGQDVLTTRYVAGGAVPFPVLGTVALNGYLSTSGTLPNVDVNGTVDGIFTIRDVALAASYAAQLGSRFSAGLSYKYVQKRKDCTGNCTAPGELDPSAGVRPSTSAVDLGLQYDVGKMRAVHLGAALRNLGLRLQTRDRAQADPLPTQLALGASYDVPQIEKYLPETSVRVLTEASTGVGVRLDKTVNVGAEAVYRRIFALRLGYNTRSGGYSGPSFGFGLQARHLSLDIAQQVVSDLFADKAPTYVGIRYAF